MAEPVQPKAKVVEHPVKQEGIFDHRTHIRDANTGRLIAYNPYTTHIHGTTTMHERPIGSGNMFSPNGEPIGRWAFEDKAWKKLTAEHSEVKTQYLTSPDQLEQENESLKRELAAMKAEQATKITPTNGQKK